MVLCFFGLYIASNFNHLQSASNVALDVNVQTVLPAVQSIVSLGTFKQPHKNGGAWLPVL